MRVLWFRVRCVVLPPNKTQTSELNADMETARRTTSGAIGFRWLSFIGLNTSLVVLLLHACFVVLCVMYSFLNPNKHKAVH